MEYKIKAIETTYNNRIFRSRLEATWAAFFDLCGWDWEYEPLDMDGWLPDFLIRRKTEKGSGIFVEVKPFDFASPKREQTEDRKQVYSKIKKAIPNNSRALILGISPYNADGGSDGMCIGDFISKDNSGDCYIDGALLNLIQIEVKNKKMVIYDLCDDLGSYSMELSGYYEGNQYEVDAIIVDKMFGTAKNKVKYTK